MLTSIDRLVGYFKIMVHVRDIAQHFLLIILVFWLLQLALLYFYGPNISDEDDVHLCMENKINMTRTCRPKCQHVFYSLPGMSHCEPWLTCSEIKNELKILRKFAYGAVKAIYQAEIRGKTVVYNVLRTKNYEEDFKHGLKMLRDLQPSKYVSQLLGYCDDSFVTEYHPFGSARDLDKFLSVALGLNYNISVRFQLCISYVHVVHFLHSGPLGTRVMCDSNDLNKLLSQFLVNPDLTFVANDLDALPQVHKGHGVKCGHRELFGDFIAPEQLWPHDEPYNDDLMPTYDEKTDIWKVPDVCNHFLGTSDDTLYIQFHLHKIHKQCKDHNPKNRPSAAHILDYYKQIKLTLGL